MSHPVTVRSNLMQSLPCVPSPCPAWNLLARVGLLGFLLMAELYRPVPIPYTLSGQAAAMEGGQHRGKEKRRRRERGQEEERMHTPYFVMNPHYLAT